MHNYIMYMNRNIPFVNAVFNNIENDTPLEEAVNLLISEEKKHEIHFLIPTTQNGQLIQDELVDDFIETRLFPFLSSTHLMLPPHDYDNITLALSEGAEFSATWRGWSSIFAEWANREKWMGYKNWQYMDFYRGLQQFNIHSYDKWRLAVLAIIKEKNKQTYTH